MKLSSKHRTTLQAIFKSSWNNTIKNVVTMLKYKGYHGKVEFDEDAGLFHGEIVDLRDVVTFQGKSVEELEQAFRDSIDDYLDFCRQRGEEPDKPFSGRLMLRLPTEVHRKIYVRAKKEGKSLNEYISEKLSMVN
jgi:predicted HicB family RNase H-like nuclease